MGVAHADAESQRDDGVEKRHERANPRHPPERVHVWQLGQDELHYSKNNAENPVCGKTAAFLAAVRLCKILHGYAARNIVCSKQTRGGEGWRIECHATIVQFLEHPCTYMR